MHPEECHKNNPGDGTPLLQGWGERAGVLQPGEEKALTRIYSGHPVPEGGLQESWGGLFIRTADNRMRGNGFELEEGRFRPDVRKKFLTVRVLRHWNKLSSEVVDAPCLEASKASLDGALSNLM